MKWYYGHFSDAGRVQVGANPEAHPQGEARHAAALRPQAAQDAGMLWFYVVTHQDGKNLPLT